MVSTPLSTVSVVPPGDATAAPLDAERLATVFERRPAEALLAWAVDRFGDRLVLVSALQAEGMVLLDLLHRIAPRIRVLTLDTGRLPEETHQLVDRIRFRYGIAVEIVHPDAHDLAALVRQDGPNAFLASVAARKSCCRVRKVEPLRRALRGAGAWMTGLRRAQSDERAHVRKVTADLANASGGAGLLKLSPLADWSHDRVWEHIRSHDVPYHPLYGQGYTSIGCAPCTRATTPGEHPRAGRWWWEQGVKECGLHDRPASRSAPAALPVVGG